MNELTFWFYFVLFCAGCGIGLLIETIMLIIKAVRNRPKRKMISSVGMTWDDFEKELSYKQITKGITAERLSEICAAEQEGRCVILPCKIGTPTYVIAKDCKNNPDHSKYCFCFGKSCTTCEDSYDRVWETTSKTTDIRTIVENMGLCGENGGFGKTVFLTKEQAESKLAEMKGE